MKGLPILACRSHSLTDSLQHRVSLASSYPATAFETNFRKRYGVWFPKCGCVSGLLPCWRCMEHDAISTRNLLQIDSVSVNELCRTWQCSSLAKVDNSKMKIPKTETGGTSMGWTGARTNLRLSEAKPRVRGQVCESNEQVHKQVSFPHPLAHPLAHPDVPYHLGIFRPISLQKLLFCMQMFTYKADFGGKVGLRDEEVKMNESVNGWECKCIYREATCAITCALTCSVTCSCWLHSLTRAVTCAITRVSTCSVWYVSRPSSWKTLFTYSSKQLNMIAIILKGRTDCGAHVQIRYNNRNQTINKKCPQK